MSDVISMQIPKKPEYISIARLAVSGIAMQMGFHIHAIDDVKVSLAEACISAFKLSQKNEISIEFEVREDRLIVRVEDVRNDSTGQISQYKELKMGELIIDSLMDGVSYQEGGIEMCKILGDDMHGYD